MHRIILPFFLATGLVAFSQAPQKTFTEKLDGINTSSKELTKNSSTDNSSVGQSGQLNTSVPLVTISSRTLTFPLQLNYAAGIKVDQSSGDVGLGWAMPIGSIVRDYGSFEPDYTSTTNEAQMKSSTVSGNDGWLNSSGGSMIDPTTHSEFLGYNAIDATAMNMPVSDKYHINVPGFLSNSFWNENVNNEASYNWAFGEFERWKVDQRKKTFKISQEFSRINSINLQNCPNCLNKNYFGVDGSFAAAIGVLPYVKNGSAMLPSTGSNGFMPTESCQYVYYEDFEAFIITDDKGTQYVFGRPLRGQKFVFSDDPYWSSQANLTGSNSANGNFWKIDFIAEWLLTEIRTVDYVDVNENGIADDGDAGDWIRFEYTEPTKTEQTVLIGGGGDIRLSQSVPSYREWSNYSQTDRASSLMREHAYLTKIITPTQYLDLTISPRMEVEHDYYSKPANKVGNSYYYEDRHYSSSGSTGSNKDFDIMYPVETMKYDSIKIYSKLIDKTLYPSEKLLTGAIVLKYAEKGSSQELAVSSYLIRKNNNEDKLIDKPSDTNPFDIELYKNSIDKRGKTTLLGVDYLGSDLNTQDKTSYIFEYAYNPSYDEIHKREIAKKYFFPSLRGTDYTYPDQKSEAMINYSEKVIGSNGLYDATSVQHTGISPHEFLIDFPYVENYYKYNLLTANNINGLVVFGTEIVSPISSYPIAHPLKPIQSVFGYLTSENCTKCPEAWSLTSITYPTGGTVSFVYEEGEYNTTTDKTHWSFDDTELPLIKEYNDLAKKRSCVQDAYNKYAENIGAYSSTSMRKTLTATFEVPLPSKIGIRLKSKSINDKINPVVTISYEYNSGHFTSLPSDYLASTLSGFNSFLMKEKHRHDWEKPYYTTVMAQLPGWTTNYNEKMQHVAISNISLDDYSSTYFYESIREIQVDQSKVIKYYSSIGDNIYTSYPFYALYCTRLPIAGRSGRYIIGGSSVYSDPIELRKVESYEALQSLPYKTVNYNYSYSLVSSKEIKFNYGNSNNTISLWNNTFENWLPIYYAPLNHYGPVEYMSQYSVTLGPFSAVPSNDWLTVGGVDEGFAFAYDAHTISSSYTLTLPLSAGYERWCTTKLQLFTEETNYKGIVTKTTNTYDPNTFELTSKEQNYPSLNKKHITTYEYAEATYSGLTSKFTDLNLLGLPTRTTTYLNTISAQNALNSQMVTYDYTTLNVPQVKNQYVYETQVDALTGVFTYVPFNLGSATNPNWRIDQNDNLDYNNNNNVILSRTNRLYNKVVYGNNLNVSKANFSYPNGKFDATYSGFEDFHGLHVMDDWNIGEYKKETWFAKDLIVEPTTTISIATGNACGNSYAWYSPYQSAPFYHVVSVDDITSISLDSPIEMTFTTNGQTTVFNTIITGIIPQPIASQNYGAVAAYTLDYVLCFSDPINFPFNNPLNQGNEDPVLPENSFTITSLIGSAEYNLSNAYSRTGEYSYRLRTKRTDTEEFPQTPVRPVKIISQPTADCIQEVPDDASVKSMVVPSHCKWTYEASVWLKYDLDYPELDPANDASNKSLDLSGDASYLRGDVSETNTGSGVKIVCDVYNSTRSILLDQKIFYVDALDVRWKQYTVDVTFLKQGNKWLDVYVVNEQSQVGQPLSDYKSVYVDDIAIYPKGSKYTYQTVNKYAAPTYSVDNNDVFVETVYDSKARPIISKNQYGTKIKEYEYFEHPNWVNKENYITERSWIDNGLYNQSRYYLDGFGKTKQVIVSDEARGARIISETNVFNNKGQVVQSYKPYTINGSTLTTSHDLNYGAITNTFYGSNYAYTEVTYEPKPEDNISMVKQPRLNNESVYVKSQSNYLSPGLIESVTASVSYPAGTLLVYQVTDENGSVVRTYIDAMGRVVMEEHEIGLSHVQNPNGSISSTGTQVGFARTWFKYDDAGRLTEVYDPENKHSVYTYNSLGVLIKSQSPDKGTSELRYDKYGQVRFVKNQKDIQATANNIYGTDQFKYSKYDAWGRLIESGMVMASPNTTGLNPASLPFPTGNFFNNQQKIDDQSFPLNTAKLVQVHAQYEYDGLRDEFSSTQLLREKTYSEHVLNAGYDYTSGATDQKDYAYMADGQLANVRYTYAGLAGTHTIEPIYNSLRIQTGTSYIHPSQPEYNFTWESELDNFGRVKTNQATHNGITTQTGKNYYDIFGNLLMQGLGSTGNSANPHIDYVAFKHNIRNQLVSQMSQNLRIGLTYDMVGNISNQYWSNEHYDPTTGSTITVNQYQYSYDKMNRLTGADYKTGSYTQNPFGYYDNIMSNIPTDFLCGVNEQMMNQVLRPIFMELDENIRNEENVELSKGSINALNTLKVEYLNNNVSYSTMTETEKDVFLEKYIQKAKDADSDPIYYEQYMAEKNRDKDHLDALRDGDFGITKLKYINQLLQSFVLDVYQSCEPNLASTVYGFLPTFQLPTTTTNGTKYDAAYWYSQNGNMTQLNRNDELGVKTKQVYNYSNSANNLLTGVTWTNMSTNVSIPHQYQYDPTGNLLTDPRNGVTAIDYISYNDMPQSITNGSGTKRYRYDNAGQRIVKVNGANDQEYYIGNVILEANGQVKSYQTVEGFATASENAGVVSVEYFYNIKDWLGTNRLVLDVAGTIVNASDHYPYGLSMPGRHFVTENEGDRYQFTGHQYDGETNYEYHGARYYNRELGRYMSVDPMASKAFGWSTYRYCFNNPIMYTDPNGRFETRKEAREYKKENDISGRVRKDSDGEGYNISNKYTNVALTKGTQWEIDNGYTDQDGIVQSAFVLRERNQKRNSGSGQTTGINAVLSNMVSFNVKDYYSVTATATYENEKVLLDYWTGDRISTSAYSSTTENVHTGKNSIMGFDVSTDVASGNQTYTVSVGPISTSGSIDDLSIGHSLNVGSFSFGQEISFSKGYTFSVGSTNDKGVTTGTKVSVRPGIGTAAIILLEIGTAGQINWVLPVFGL